MFHCKNCEDRYVGCHSRCEKYQKDKAEHERLKSLKKADHEVAHYVCEIICNSRDAAAKRRKKTNTYSKFKTK